jgi:AcrR family transcriptional regulator
MPKIVDHEARRQALAEATWCIIRKEGLEAVSVRKIASEANVSLGLLRHYFNNQSELISFSMNLVSRRVRQRIVKMNYKGESLKEILMMITELMPMDSERQAEGEVWLAFMGQAIYDPNIHLLRSQVHQEMYGFFQHIMVCLSKCCFLKQAIDCEMETKRLHALVDGLVVHYLIHPDMMTIEKMSSIVEDHLGQLIISEKQILTED